MFYIGFGKGDRYTSLKKRNQEFLKFISAYECHAEILQSNLTDEEAKEVEKRLIYEYWEIGQAQTNLRAGGSGGNTVKYMSEEGLAYFKDTISKHSKTKWQNPEVRERIVNSIHEAMATDRVKHKISALTKEGMRTPENWERFIKGRAKTTTIIFPDGSSKIFESKTAAGRYLEPIYGVSFPFFKESKNIYVTNKSIYYPLVGITIKIKDKYNNECVTTICDECSRVG